jgi:hypothetical protein
MVEEVQNMRETRELLAAQDSWGGECERSKEVRLGWLADAKI